MITRSTEPTKEENATNGKFRLENTVTLIREIKKQSKPEGEPCDNEEEKNDEEKSNTTTDLEALLLEANDDDSANELKFSPKHNTNKVIIVLLTNRTESEKQVIARNRTRRKQQRISFSFPHSIISP